MARGILSQIDARQPAKVNVLAPDISDATGVIRKGQIMANAEEVLSNANI
jgi:hypothetical protein